MIEDTNDQYTSERDETAPQSNAAAPPAVTTGTIESPADGETTTPEAVEGTEEAPKPKPKRKTRRQKAEPKTGQAADDDDDDDVADTTPIAGDPIRQNIKLVGLLRDHVAALDSLVTAAGVQSAMRTSNDIRKLANSLEVEVSIIVGS